MRILSWNLNGRCSTAPQVASILSLQPDVIALQEVTKTTVNILRAALAAAGYDCFDSFSLAPSDFQATGPRRYALIIASCYPLAAIPPGQFPVPWPERVLSAMARTPNGLVEIHNTHVPPGSSNGWIKIEHLSGLFEGLARSSEHARILCGDFNTPQIELLTGEIITWAQRRCSSGEWKVVRSVQGGTGIEWDAGERRILSGLAVWDMYDVYRSIHGYNKQEASWILRRRSGDVGRRFDHIFASSALVPLHCSYVHDLRTSGLSDHSAIQAQFDWPGCAI
jgi:exonuclease III